MLIVQANLATTYGQLGHLEKALSMQRDVYSGRLKLSGEEHEETFRAAINCAASLNALQRFKEAKPLLRRTVPVARRVLGEGHGVTLRMRHCYARALHDDPAATRDDLREAATTLEDAERTARRVFGGAHPLTLMTESTLRNARVVLAARDGDNVSSVCEALRKAEV